ncbi:MAG: MBL fold metallo-hydrolase [Sphingobacteriales bacterium]|nr:MAG: MBL fold metallo-hydrolase [Sphingobacteriales bacterium]
MAVEQLYTKCLSEAAYFIHDGSEAAVIDPLRDVDEYIEKADVLGVTIKYIFETHFHADFVSGHRELSQKTGAPIVYGAQANAGFDFHKAQDGERFSVGNLTIEALHTPGHTLESTCYLLRTAGGVPEGIFTGDTLFVGDVGRPDLFSGDMTKEELAGMLYESLETKIKTLPDHVVVYPAHGPGSACGKALGKETTSTIGIQKETNYALKAESKEAFVKEVTSGLSTPPVYFPLNAKLNQQGADSLDTVMERGNRALSVPEFKQQVANGAWIVDTRDSTVFTEGFVPGAISIGLDGRYAEWAGSLLPYDKKLVLVTEVGKEKESITRLARVGLDKVVGYLNGGLETWLAAGEQPDLIIDIEADELLMDLPHDPRLAVIDVRKEGEFIEGHIRGAQNLPLTTLTDPAILANIPEDANLYIHCAGGYRSVIAASILKREGFHNLRNVLGGWGTMKDIKGMPVVKEKVKLN